MKLINATNLRRKSGMWGTRRFVVGTEFVDCDSV